MDSERSDISIDQISMRGSSIRRRAQNGTPSIWAKGFEPQTPKQPTQGIGGRQAPKCGPGNKVCGRRCIANHMKCYIGTGKVGLAQKALGLAAVGAGIYAASRPNANALAQGAGLAVGLGGAALMARGSYNLGRSAGQSREKGAMVKSALGYPDIVPGTFFQAGLQEGRRNLKRRTSEGKLRRTQFQAASQSSILGMGALANRALKG